MPANTAERVPRYCRHKASGQAVVYVARRAVYLGPYGSDESLRHYREIVARWQAGGAVAVFADRRQAAADLTVLELVARFLAWARGRYVRSPNELSAFAVGTRRLLRLHAETPVERFGPVALQAVRSAMVADGLRRTTVNAAVHRIRRIWRWGVRNELLAETRWRALLSVPALAAGEEHVRESEPVRPAGWRQVRAVLRHAPEPVRVMVKLQILTGMRPGEVVRLRPADIEQSAGGWLYRPPRHKTASRGKRRVVLLGPHAQALLAEWLPADPQAYVFQPHYALADYNARRRRPGHRPPSHQPARRRSRRRARGAKPRRVADRYTVAAYRTAIRRACERVWPLPPHLARSKGESAVAWRARLGPEAWLEMAAWRRKHLLHPHQLRHSFATRVGNRFGEAEAQVLLGHSRLQTTEIYVERDIRRGRRIIDQVG